MLNGTYQSRSVNFGSGLLVVVKTVGHCVCTENFGESNTQTHIATNMRTQNTKSLTLVVLVLMAQDLVVIVYPK